MSKMMRIVFLMLDFWTLDVGRWIIGCWTCDRTNYQVERQEVRCPTSKNPMSLYTLIHFQTEFAHFIEGFVDDHFVPAEIHFVAAKTGFEFAHAVVLIGLSGA